MTTYGKFREVVKEFDFPVLAKAIAYLQKSEQHGDDEKVDFAALENAYQELLAEEKKWLLAHPVSGVSE